VAERRTVVLYPHLGPKAGTGHIKRLLPFFSDVRFKVYVIHRNPKFVKEISNKFDIDSERVFPLSEIKTIPDNIDLIVLDNRESDRYLYDKLKNVAPIVAIDEGGDSRKLIPYTIDILPNLLDSRPNYNNIGLLDLNIKDPIDRELKNILISFGGQDPYQLTRKAVDALKDKYSVTTVIGPLFTKKDFGVNKIENLSNLKNIFSNYDLVITSFGLTAYEAAAEGVPVALVNPTQYHQDLSNKAGFYTLDNKFNINYKKAKKLFNNIEFGIKESLTDFIYNLEVSSLGCPICGRKNNSSIQRFKNRTYYHCFHCSVDYMAAHQKDVTYSNNYFFEDYKEQYGKTYLEDFDHISNLGLGRINNILKKVKTESTLLDIGCAYGPFLKAAESKGLIPYGLDVSKDAVDYINNELDLKAINSPFPLSKPLDFNSSFDCITMWYVIEHFKNIDDVLTQVNNLLNSGGVFAFSTPNSAGISSKKSHNNFLKNSPDDHFTIWSPKSAKKVLKEYGFKVYKVKMTGHHPNRFGRYVKGKFLHRLFMIISHVFKLGDTFEIYCIKETTI